MPKLNKETVDLSAYLQEARAAIPQFQDLLTEAKNLWPQRNDLKTRTMREDAMLEILCALVDRQATYLQRWSEALVKVARMSWPPPRDFNEVLEIHHDGELISQLGFVADSAVKIFAGGTNNADEAVAEAMELWEALAKKYPDGVARDCTEYQDDEGPTDNT